MAVEIITSLTRQVDENGIPISGAKVYVYNVGTTTLKNVFSDNGLSTAADNPIVCNSYGLHDMRYIASGSYKIVVKTNADVAVYTRDNIDGRVPVGSGALAIANGGTGATTAEAALTALGAVSTGAITALETQVAELAGASSSSEKTHIATGTTAQRPYTPAEGDIRRNTTLGYFEGYDGSNWRPIPLTYPIAAGFKNLSITNNSGTPNSKADVTADAVTVETSGGVAYRVTSVSVTIDCATTGANGLDAGSLANSTWYSVWIIYNPTTNTTAGLMATSASSPTLPSGYTAQARVGWMRTNGSAQLYRTIQKGRNTQYIVGTNPSGAIEVIVGATGNVNTPTWTTQSISSFVPSTASHIDIYLSSVNSTSNSKGMVAPNSSYGSYANNTKPAPISIYDSNTQVASMLMLESTNIYAALESSVHVWCKGWADNI